MLSFKQHLLEDYEDYEEVIISSCKGIGIAAGILKSMGNGSILRKFRAKAGRAADTLDYAYDQDSEKYDKIGLKILQSIESDLWKMVEKKTGRGYRQWIKVSSVKKYDTVEDGMISVGVFGIHEMYHG